MKKTPAEHIRTPWWVLLILGSLCLGVGALLLFDFKPSPNTLLQLVALYWFGVGILDLGRMFHEKRRWFWPLLSGTVGAAMALIVSPYSWWAGWFSPELLFVVFGGVGVLCGFLRLVQGFSGSGAVPAIVGSFDLLLGVLFLGVPFFSPLPLQGVVGLLAMVAGAGEWIAAWVVRRSWA